MTAATQFLDSLITEYLSFRGFTSSAAQFAADQKTDKDKGFKVERIVEELVHCMTDFELTRLCQLWQHLCNRIFLNLSHVQQEHSRTLENDLYKLYLANSVQHDRKGKMREFFELLGSRLHTTEGWADWFAIAYIPNVQDREPFRMYFSKQWQQTFFVTVHNFLSICFHQCELPALYCCVTAADPTNNLPKLPSEDKESFIKISSALMRLQSPNDDFMAFSSDMSDDYSCIAACSSSDRKSNEKSLGSKIRQKLKGTPKNK